MAYEDFSTYTETDPSGDITIGEAGNVRITVDTMLNPVQAGVYKDLGAGHFSGDFEHLIDIYFGIFIGTGANVIVGGVSDGAYTWTDMDTANKGLAVYILGVAGPLYKIYLRDFDGGLWDAWTTDSHPDNWYLTVKKDATAETYTAKIYSDASRTILKDTIMVSLGTPADTYDYIIGVGSRELAGTQESSLWVENLDLQEGAPPAGIPIFWRRRAG